MIPIIPRYGYTAQRTERVRANMAMSYVVAVLLSLPVAFLLGVFAPII